MLGDKQVYPSTTPPDTNGYEYIDFGLPSGNLWAVKNIGAELPYEPGTYFLFGDPVGVKPYGGVSLSPEQHKWKNNYPSQKLNLEDDPAHVAMGGDWQTPTKEDFKELFNYLLNSNSYWTMSAYNSNTQDTVGLLAGFNVPYPDDPDIIYKTNVSSLLYEAIYMEIITPYGMFYLPASGYRAISSLYFEHNIYFQCSEKDPANDNLCIVVNMDTSEGKYDSLYQYYGFNIRPVCKK